MNPFIVPLNIKPGFSRTLLLVLISAAFVAIIVIMSLPLHLLVKLAGSMIILIWLVVVLREHCWHLDQAIRMATLRTDNSWLVSFDGQEPVKADLLPGCLVQPWLTVLQFKIPDRRRRSLILLRDNVDADTFRRLRVRLKNSD